MLRSCARYCGRWVVNVLSFTLTGLVCVVAFLEVRLAMGPVRLDVLTPEIERQINAELDGWRVSVGRAALSWSRSAGDVGVQLMDVELYDPEGVRAAGAPEVGVSFALGPAIRGVARPSAARLVGADALLVRTEDGLFRFAMFDQSIAPPEEEPTPLDDVVAAPDIPDEFIEEETFAAVARIVEGLTGDRDGVSALAAFRNVQISDFRLTYRDEMGGDFWVAPSAMLSITRTAVGLEAALDAAVESAEGGPPLTLEVVGERRSNSDSVTVSARFADAPPAGVASQAPMLLSALSAIEGEVSGAIDARIRLSDGAAEAISAELFATDAMLAAPDAEPLHLDRFDAAAEYDRAADSVVVSRLAATIGPLSVAMHGEAAFARDADGAARGADVQIVLDQVVIDDPDIYPEPMRIDEGEIALTIADAPFRVSAPAFRAVVDGVEVSGAATFHVSNGGPRGAVVGRLSEFDAVRLSALWPRVAAPGAWRWVDANIQSGRVTGAAFAARFSDDVDALDLSFDFEDVESTYLDEMTPITGAVGSGRVTLADFRLALDAGQVDLGDAGTIELAGSEVLIPSFEPKIPPAEIDIAGTGEIAAILSLIDEPPLGFVSKLGLAPDAVRGSADVAARLAFPLAKALTLPEILVDVQADLRNAALVAPKIELPIVARRGRLVVDTSRLELNADATLDGFPAQVRWREVFSPARGAARSTFVVQTSLDRDDVAALGGPATHMTGGEVAAEATARLIDGRPAEIEATLDLADAALAIRPLGWSKPLGAPGEARVVAQATDDALILETIAAEIGAGDAALSLEGAAELERAGALRALTLEHVRLGPETDIALTVQPSEAGGWTVSLTGPFLDLSPSIAALSGGGAESDGDGGASSDASGQEPGQEPGQELGRSAPIVVHAAVDAVRLSETTVLREVAANVLLDADQSVEADAMAIARGPDGERAPLKGAYSDRDGARSFWVESVEAGALLRALGFFEDGRAGEARIDAEIEADGAITGELRVEDFVVEDAPELAQILSVATVLGIFDAIQSGGISFSRVSAPFRLEEGVLHVSDAAASGPSLGLTLDGVYDRRSGALDFDGSVSPAFAINGLVAGVPVLGDILTGGSGEGIIGVAYQISGTTEEPDVFVNPLSALAPGPFRRLFRGGSNENAPALSPRAGER